MAVYDGGGGLRRRGIVKRDLWFEVVVEVDVTVVVGAPLDFLFLLPLLCWLND